MRWKVGMSHMDDGRLHALLDEELTPEETGQLRAHLAACAECRERLDVAREVRTRAHAILRLADPPPVEMPDFATLRARGVRSAPAATGSWRQRSLLLPWAASLLVAVGAGWFAQELIRGSRDGGAERVAAVQSESMEAAEQAPPAIVEQDEQQERAALVRAALESLAERDREVLQLWDAGLNYGEIAAQTGLAAGSIGTTLARARQRLADAYHALEGGNVAHG